MTDLPDWATKPTWPTDDPTVEQPDVIAEGSDHAENSGAPETDVPVTF
mgnify:CR=1 FL=1